MVDSEGHTDSRENFEDNGYRDADNSEGYAEDNDDSAEDSERYEDDSESHADDCEGNADDCEYPADNNNAKLDLQMMRINCKAQIEDKCIKITIEGNIEILQLPDAINNNAFQRKLL